MIARHDLRARVVERDRLSGSCFRLRLQASEHVEACPGQFAMVRCSGGLDPLLRRAFSLAAARTLATGSEIELMVKMVGRGTGCLARVRPGDEIDVLVPLGRGFDLAAAGTRPALVVGGIGLPPLLFAAEVLAERGVSFDLFVGAGTADELLDVDRCATIAARVGGELVLTTDDGSRGEPGLVTAALARRVEQGRRYSGILTCGPTAMLKAVARYSVSVGIPAQVSLEEPMACGVGVCLGCVVELEDGSLVPSCKEGPVFSVDRLHQEWWA